MHLLSARSRSARRNRTAAAGWWLHFIGAIALVAGLFLPLTSFGMAAAAPAGEPASLMRMQSDTDTVPPQPAQVTAVGSFQTELGCAEYDPYCQTTQLSEHQGIWTGVFSVPPGQYDWQIQAVLPDGNVISYGDGGLGGTPQQISVGDGDAGLYFRLNTHTNEVDAAPVGALYTANVDGLSVALEPDGGQLTALVTSQQGGPATVRALAGGEALGASQQVDLNQGPNRLTFSPDGQLLNVESLPSASLTIERLDADGDALPGGCYQLRSGNTLVNQACDADDGADGYTAMTFPEGIPGGAVSVIEVTPPDGAEPIEDQQIQLEPGNLFITLQPEAAADSDGQAEQEEGGQVIEAQDEDDFGAQDIDEDDGFESAEVDEAAPGDLIVRLAGATGNLIPGACFKLLQDGDVVEERCDREPDDEGEFANNGSTGFFEIPEGVYTLRLSEAPDAATADDQPVEIVAGQQVTVDVTAELPEPEEEPTPTETPLPEPANFTVTLQDQNGAPVGGACFQLVQDGQVVEEACDREPEESAEFANNGNVGFFDLTPGSYTLRMSEAPVDVSAISDRQVEIAPGSDDTEFIQIDVAEPTAVPTQALAEGDIVVLREDADGNPVGGACFEVIDQGGSVIQTAVCDEDGDVADDGRVGLLGVPEGSWVLRETRTPQGYEPAPDTQVEVTADGVSEVEIASELIATEEIETPQATSVPTEEATEEAGEPGDLIVEIRTAEGEPVPNACFQLVEGEEVESESCDTPQYEANPGNGNIGFYNIDPGTYTLRNVENPEGEPLAEDREVEVPSGDDVTERIEIAAAETETPEATETPEPTQTPTEEATEEAGEGNLTVTLLDDAGDAIAGACWELLDGETVVQETCDTSDWESEQFANNGNAGFFDVPAGTYTLRMTSAPEGVSADDEQVEIVDGGDDTVTITATAAPTEEDAAADATEETTDDVAPEPGPPANQIVEIRDQNGDTVGGACLELEMEGQAPIEVCDADDPFPDNGRIGFFGVPSGPYTLSQSTVPSGTNPIEEQEITIEPGDNPDMVVTTSEGASISSAQSSLNEELQDEPEDPAIGGQVPGTVLVDVSALDGDDICVQLDTTGGIGFASPPQACDNGDDDENDEPGLIELRDIEPGEYQLTVTGTANVEPETIMVSADAPTQITLGDAALTPTSAPTTGTLTIDVVDGSGNPVGGVCFDISTPAGEPFTFCDEDNDGTIEVPDVTFGTQTIAPNSIPAQYSAPAAQEVELSLEEQSASVEFQLETATGAIQVTTLDDEGNPVPGACVALDDRDPACDEDDGSITFEDVPVGGHTVSQVRVPEGHEPPQTETQQVTVADEDIAQVQFTNPDATGNIQVQLEDDAENALTGFCASLDNDTDACDDGSGMILFEDVPVGEHAVALGSTPAGYSGTGSEDVVVETDETETVTFTATRDTGSVQVQLQDEATSTLVGFCASLDSGDAVCDNESGTILFEDVPVGEHTISLTNAPQGYSGPADSETVEVAADETATVTFTATRDTGTVQVLIRDTEGNVVPGACATLDEGAEVCDTAAAGQILFEDVPTGQHEVAQSEDPEGYVGVTEPQQVTVESGDDPAVVTLENELVTGSVAVTVVDTGDTPVQGVCVGLSDGEDDPDTLCEPDDAGVYGFDNVVPGTYTVSVSQVPEQYVALGAEQIDVTAGEEATVEFELDESLPETGGAQLALLTEDGQAASGVCVLLTSLENGEEFGPYCDNGDNDGDVTEGVLLVEDLPVGEYEVTFPNQDQGATSRLEVAGAMLPSLQDGEAIIIEVTADETLEVDITVPGLFVLGSIEVRTVDAESGEPVAGACYSIDTTEPTDVCDEGSGDESPDAGTVLVTGLSAGEYTIRMTSPPDGYSAGGEQVAEVTGGQTASLSFEVTAEITTGTLTVSKVDPAGEPLAGACFRLQTGEGTIARACDDADGNNDGTINFSDIPAGRYELVETRTPEGYQAAPTRTVEITADGEAEVQVENTASPGRLNVIKVDAADQTVRLDGACFELRGGTTYGPFCDGDDLSEDGRTVFTNVTPGTYTLVETEAPRGYDPTPDREVTIRGGVTLQVTIQNQETPPPPEAGTLVVNKLGPNEDPLAGGCFRLYDGDSPVTDQVCDITDGTNDSRIVFEDVPAGSWTLRETLAPSPSYQLAPDQGVTIEDDETTEVDVVNTFKNGRILVNKVTPKGQPIAGACFQLNPDRDDPLCSDETGEILFENLPVGTYTLTETTTPYGFREADPVEGIEVRPAQTTVVTVENERQPPPNTGSVQLLKFVCPVDTADEERTAFLGGAAGNAELAKTKGCAPANAEFTLVGQDGSDGPGAFSTGNDGKFLATLPAKVYRLDETNPDLPGNSAALLRVDVGRMTTVVVINYVAPPEPEPVDINVTKYTCQAGFNGTTFTDFAENCMAASQLTNNITVRAEGPANLRTITGDGGQAGRTAFADQPAGTYTIYEERPYNIPTNYGFCGWDSGWPVDYKTVNGAITADLGEGEGLHCVLFNIPEPVTDSTGVILVRKYVCDVEAPPKGYDFESECRLSDEQATFELKRFNEEMQDYGDGVQETANPDGILRFVDLRPGTFQLREVDNNWCYANSNSVNTKGDVVVRAGQVSLVSIYNCVGTSEPPNTGSGDAAGLLNPTLEPAMPASGEVGVTPGIAWPIAIIAVVFALRPRRVLAPGRDWNLEEEKPEAARARCN